MVERNPGENILKRMEFGNCKVNSGFYFVLCVHGNTQQWRRTLLALTPQGMEAKRSPWIMWASISTTVAIQLLDFNLCGKCRLLGVLGREDRYRTFRILLLFWTVLRNEWTEWTIQNNINCVKAHGSAILMHTVVRPSQAYFPAQLRSLSQGGLRTRSPSCHVTFCPMASPTLLLTGEALNLNSYN